MRISARRFMSLLPFSVSALVASQAAAQHGLVREGFAPKTGLRVASVEFDAASAMAFLKVDVSIYDDGEEIVEAGSYVIPCENRPKDDSPFMCYLVPESPYGGGKVVGPRGVNLFIDRRKVGGIDRSTNPPRARYDVRVVLQRQGTYRLNAPTTLVDFPPESRKN